MPLASQVPHSHLLPPLLAHESGLKPLFDAPSAREWTVLVPRLQQRPFDLPAALGHFAPHFNPHYLPRRDSKSRSIWCDLPAALQLQPLPRAAARLPAAPLAAPATP